MTTYTVFGAEDFTVECVSTTYANARAGTDTISVDSTNGSTRCGQNWSSPNFFCAQMFMRFDTSLVPSGTPSTAVTLTINVAGAPTTSFPLNVGERNWASVATSAFIAGASLSGVTDFGALTISSTGAKVITGPADVARTANYKLALWSNRQETNSAPIDNERAVIFSARRPGTTEDPYLTIVLPYVGTANITEAADTLTAAGTVLVEGTANLTEASDTLAATGQNQVRGAAVITEAADTLAAEGDLKVPVTTPAGRRIVMKPGRVAQRTITLKP